MWKVGFLGVLSLGLCSCSNEKAANPPQQNEIRVTGDLSNGNIVKGLLLAIDKKDASMIQNFVSTQAAFEVPLDNLKSRPDCAPWSVISVGERVLIARDCRNGGKAAREAYYLTVENTGARVAISSLARDGKTVRIEP